MVHAPYYPTNVLLNNDGMYVDGACYTTDFYDNRHNTYIR